jgi:hypothetical protein
MCTEARELRVVAAYFSFNCWYLDISSDNRSDEAFSRLHGNMGHLTALKTISDLLMTILQQGINCVCCVSDHICQILFPYI